MLGVEHEPNPDPTVHLASAYSHGWLTGSDVLNILDGYEWPEIVVDHKQSELIEVTAQLWDCQYLWLVRNPRDTVASLVKNRWYLPGDDEYPPGYLHVYGQWQGKLADITMHNQSGNRTRGDYLGIGIDVWREMSQVERCGWYWNWINNRILTQLTPLHGRWALARLEDSTLPHDRKTTTGFRCLPRL